MEIILARTLTVSGVALIPVYFVEEYIMFVTYMHVYAHIHTYIHTYIHT